MHEVAVAEAELRDDPPSAAAARVEIVDVVAGLDVDGGVVAHSAHRAGEPRRGRGAIKERLEVGLLDPGQPLRGVLAVHGEALQELGDGVRREEVRGTAGRVGRHAHRGSAVHEGVGERRRRRAVVAAERLLGRALQPRAMHEVAGARAAPDVVEVPPDRVRRVAVALVVANRRGHEVTERNAAGPRGEPDLAVRLRAQRGGGVRGRHELARGPGLEALLLRPVADVAVAGHAVDTLDEDEGHRDGGGDEADQVVVEHDRVARGPVVHRGPVEASGLAGQREDGTGEVARPIRRQALGVTDVVEELVVVAGRGRRGARRRRLGIDRRDRRGPVARGRVGYGGVRLARGRRHACLRIARHGPLEVRGRAREDAGRRAAGDQGTTRASENHRAPRVARQPIG